MLTCLGFFLYSYIPITPQDARQLDLTIRSRFQMNQLSSVQQFILAIVPVLFAITLHEVAHGWIALRLGDKTALMMGRLTINPINHIDPIGTILVPMITYYFGGFIIGWAKPVPVTWGNLRNPKRDMAWVALAGPAANLVMTFFGHSLPN